MLCTHKPHREVPLLAKGSWVPIIEAWSRSSESHFRFPTLTHPLQVITHLCVLIILSLGLQYHHYSISVCSLSWPIFHHHSFVIPSSFSIWSSSASNATSCIFKNIWLSKLRNSWIVSCPELQESATYRLKRSRPPDGGFAMSTMTYGKVWPCEW